MGVLLVSRRGAERAEELAALRPQRPLRLGGKQE
jgi:hypothetical protein